MKLPYRLEGQFGQLTIVRYFGASGHGALWSCLCSCGTAKVIRADHLRSGAISSCGCLVYTQNGLSRHPLFSTWSAMIARCHNPNHASFEEYGARGIKVCSQWRESFTAFVEDMGPKPTPAHSIDRIDNGGSYHPSNCRWALPSEQNRNKRSTVIINYAGVSLPLSEWAESLNLNPRALYYRIKILGWSSERALTEPLRQL